MADQQVEQLTRDDAEPARLTGPAKVGAELRAVRQQLGWTLPDLSDRLKIRLVLLNAIEAGDLAALPAPAYAAGFIRSYAETLGLDSDEILRRFRAEGMTPPKQPKLVFPEPVPDRAVPPGALALLALVIAVGGYFLWYRHSEHELRMAEAVPPVPAKLAPLEVPKSDLPKPAPAATAKSAPIANPVSSKPVPPPAQTVASTPAQTQASAPVPVSPVSAPDGAASQAPTVPPSNPGPAVAANSAAGVSGQPATGPDVNPPNTPATDPGVASASAAATVPPASAPAAPATVPPISSSPLVVSATADSWVQIRDAQGKILFSRVLKAGDSWPVPDEPGLTLTTGNAGGTIVVRNGEAGPPLGAKGAVLHHVPLTKPVAAPAAPASATQSSPPAALTNSTPAPTSSPVIGPSSPEPSASGQ